MDVVGLGRHGALVNAGRSFSIKHSQTFVHALPIVCPQLQATFACGNGCRHNARNPGLRGRVPEVGQVSGPGCRRSRSTREDPAASVTEASDFRSGKEFQDRRGGRAKAAVPRVYSGMVE